MASNVAGMVREGIAAFKAGRRQEALKLLSKATELDERNEEAWLWLSAVVDTLENQQICLENVLAINPNNTRALQGLEAIRRQIAKKQQGGQASSASPFDLNAPVSNSADLVEFERVNATPPTTPGQTTMPPNEEAGYHGSGKQVALPSEDEYDAWVEGLGLAGSPPPEAPRKGTDPFDFDGGPFQPASVPDAGDFDTQAAEEEPYTAQPAFGDMVSPEPDQGEMDSGQAFDPFALPQSGAYDSGFGEHESDFDSGDAPNPQAERQITQPF